MKNKLKQLVWLSETVIMRIPWELKDQVYTILDICSVVGHGWLVCVDGEGRSIDSVSDHAAR